MTEPSILSITAAKNQCVIVDVRNYFNFIFSVICSVCAHFKNEDPLEIWSFQRGVIVSNNYGRRCTILKSIEINNEEYLIKYHCNSLVTGIITEKELCISLIRCYKTQEPYEEYEKNRVICPSIKIAHAEVQALNNCDAYNNNVSFLPWVNGYETGIEQIAVATIDRTQNIKQIKFELLFDIGISTAEILLDIQIDNIVYIDNSIINNNDESRHSSVRNYLEVLKPLTIFPPIIRSIKLKLNNLELVLPNEYANSMCTVCLVPNEFVGKFYNTHNEIRGKQLLNSYIQMESRVLTNLKLYHSEAVQKKDSTIGFKLYEIYSSNYKNELNYESNWKNLLTCIYSVDLDIDKLLYINLDPRYSNNDIYLLVNVCNELSQNLFFWSKIDIRELICQSKYNFIIYLYDTIELAVDKDASIKYNFLKHPLGSLEYTYETIPSYCCDTKQKVIEYIPQHGTLFKIGQKVSEIETLVPYRDFKAFVTDLNHQLRPFFYLSNKNNPLKRVVFSSTENFHSNSKYNLTTSDIIESISREKIHIHDIQNLLTNKSTNTKIGKVSISKASHEHTYADGIGLTKAIVGHRSKFYITLCNNLNEQISDNTAILGLIFVLEYVQANKYNNTILCDSIKYKSIIENENNEVEYEYSQYYKRVYINYHIKYIQDGKHEVTYIPFVPGKYLLFIRMNSLNIIRSPSDLIVTSANPNPNNSFLYGSNDCLAYLDDQTMNMINYCFCEFKSEHYQKSLKDKKVNTDIIEAYEQWLNKLNVRSTCVLKLVIKDDYHVPIDHNIWKNYLINIYHSPEIKLIDNDKQKANEQYKIRFNIVLPLQTIINLWKINEAELTDSISSFKETLTLLQIKKYAKNDTKYNNYSGKVEVQNETKTYTSCIDVKISGTSINSCPYLIHIKNINELIDFYETSVNLFHEHIKIYFNKYDIFGLKKLQNSFKQKQKEYISVLNYYYELYLAGKLTNIKDFQKIWLAYNELRNLYNKKNEIEKLQYSTFLRPNIGLCYLNEKKKEYGALKSQEISLKYKLNRIKWQLNENSIDTLNKLEQDLKRISLMRCHKLIETCMRIKRGKFLTLEDVVIAYNDLYEELNKLSRVYLGPLIAGELLSYLEENELKKNEMSLKWREEKLNKQEKLQEDQINNLNQIWNSFINNLSTNVQKGFLLQRKYIRLEDEEYKKAFETEYKKNLEILAKVNDTWNYDKADQFGKVVPYTEISKKIIEEFKLDRNDEIRVDLLGELISKNVQATDYENSVLLSSRVIDLKIRRYISAEVNTKDDNNYVCNNLFVAISTIKPIFNKYQTKTIYKKMYHTNYLAKYLYKHYSINLNGINYLRYLNFIEDLNLPIGFRCEEANKLLLKIFEIYAVKENTSNSNSLKIKKKYWYHLLNRIAWYVIIYAKLLSDETLEITEDTVKATLPYNLPSAIYCNYIFISTFLLPLYNRLLNKKSEKEENILIFDTINYNRNEAHWL